MGLGRRKVSYPELGNAATRRRERDAAAIGRERKAKWMIRTAAERQVFPRWQRQSDGRRWRRRRFVQVTPHRGSDERAAEQCHTCDNRKNRTVYTHRPI